MPAKTLLSHFPLTRPHCGSTLGNGLQGLLVWGENTLRLTVARAGFWDHRGGQVMLPTTTFATVRSRLEADDEPGLRALYPDAPPVNGIATSPQQYGGGRLELLVQVRVGTVHVAERLPKRWRDLSFENVPVPGGFRVSAEIRHRQVRRIQISSTAGAALRLAPGFVGPWTLDGVPQGWAITQPPNRPRPTLHAARRRADLVHQ